MKALKESRCALTQQAGLILLFDGEVGPAERDRDEHNRTGILTSGFAWLPPSHQALRESGSGFGSL